MSYLFKPLKIGRINLKNRLIMPPMATSKSEDNGIVSRDVLNYYDEKSKGGYISLIIIEHSYIDQRGKAGEKQLSVASDDVIDGLKKLAHVIHENGTKAVMQLNHAGSSTSKEITGYEPAAPSAVCNPRKFKDTIPAELTADEISRLVDNFRDAAIRVKKAGFDGVEIHSAHGYLLNQFFSPLTNKRKDEYGGDILGRIKIHLDIIRAVREAVGSEYPIFLRLGAVDYMNGGTTIEDSKFAAKKFEEAGVDMLDISGGFCGFILQGNDAQGYFSPVSEAIKDVVSIPVMVTGGITQPYAAEKLLEEGKSDLIGVGRAIMNDSQWAKKAVEALS